jgi:hypothetical protein
LRGYDEGCYSLDSALKFPYGDIYWKNPFLAMGFLLSMSVKLYLYIALYQLHVLEFLF